MGQEWGRTARPRRVCELGPAPRVCRPLSQVEPSERVCQRPPDRRSDFSGLARVLTGNAVALVPGEGEPGESRPFPRATSRYVCACADPPRAALAHVSGSVSHGPVSLPSTKTVEENVFLVPIASSSENYILTLCQSFHWAAGEFLSVLMHTLRDSDLLCSRPS